MSNYLGSMCETCLEEGNKFNPRLPDPHIQNEGLQFVGSLYIFKRVFGSLKHLCVSRGWERHSVIPPSVMLWLLSFLCIQNQLWFHSGAKMWPHAVRAARVSREGRWLISKTQIKFKVLDFLSGAARDFKYFQGSQHGLTCL